MHQGLVNVGNTCSINTLIQCMGHCPTFLDTILNHAIIANKRPNHTFSIYDELKEVFECLWVKNHTIIPRRFINAFYESIGDSYVRGDQFDLTEMWMLLLNNIIEETHLSTHRSVHQDVIEYDNKALVYLQRHAQSSWEKFFNNTNSPLTDILYGIQIQQIKCKDCSKTYHNFEPVAFNYIETTHGTSMIDAFNVLLRTEETNGWCCDKCAHVTGSKLIRFWRLPRIWVIVLQRFNNLTKLIHPIDILDTLCLNSCVEYASADSKYELYAIANHYGSLNGGHYTAICKNKTSSGHEWCEYDDNNVRIVTDIDKVFAQNRNAYVLFYERV